MKGTKGLFRLGMTALAFSFMAVLAGCDNGTTSDSGGDGRTITITGITGSGAIAVNIATKIAQTTDNIIAAGTGTISNNSLTAPLKKVTNGNMTQADWTGTGEYFIYFQMGSTSSDAKMYFYTGNKTWTELGITNSSSFDDLNTKLPKYNFPEGNITLSFDQFKTPQ